MTDQVRKYLYDIQEAIRIIQDKYLAQTPDLASFEKDILIQDGIERRIITIGVALRRLRQMGIIFPKTDQMINRRNTIVHQYNEMKPRSLWTVVQIELPILKKSVLTLLNSK